MVFCRLLVLPPLLSAVGAATSSAGLTASEQTQWDAIVAQHIAATRHFRITTAESQGPAAGLYRDWVGLDSNAQSTTVISVSAVGFGLVGLCIDARLGSTSPAVAAAQLNETMSQFHRWIWPLCQQGVFCPHFAAERYDTAAQRWRLESTAELSTIDTALFVAGALLATKCLRAEAGEALVARAEMYSSSIRWGAALPPSCGGGGWVARTPQGRFSTKVWNEYYLVVLLAANSEATGGNVTGNTNCPAQRLFHRFWQPDAYESTVVGADVTSFGGIPLMSDVPGNPTPDFHIQYVAMLSRGFPPRLVADQARGSREYWSRVLANAGRARNSTYAFVQERLKTESEAALAAEVRSLRGLVGVSAGPHPSLGYHACAIDVRADERADGGLNPDFVYHLPSAYGFVPELGADLKRSLLRMYAAGVGNSPLGADPSVVVPTQRSLAKPAWRPPHITAVDFYMSVFAFARDAPPGTFGAGAGGSGALAPAAVRPAYAQGPCAAALYRRAAASGGRDVGAVNDGSAATGYFETELITGPSKHEQWVAIDLGAPHDLQNVSITWEAARPTAYALQTAPDGRAWRTVANVSGGQLDNEWTTETVTTHLGPAAAGARWLRVLMTTPSRHVIHNQWGMKIFELSLCGAATPPKEPVAASARRVASVGGGAAAAHAVVMAAILSATLAGTAA